MPKQEKGTNEASLYPKRKKSRRSRKKQNFPNNEEENFAGRDFQTRDK